MPGNSRTLSGLLALKMELGGLCDHPSHAPRFVDPDTAALIAKYGPDALTEEVMGKITCRDCHSLVEMRVSAISARAAAPGGGRSQRTWKADTAAAIHRAGQS